MVKQHTEDFKLADVKYYIDNDVSYENTSKIFNCSLRSLKRWVDIYKKTENLKRKKRTQAI